MKVCFTGARPNSLGNCFKWKDKKRIKLRDYIKQQMIKLLESDKDKEVTFYSGMALGLDQDAFSVILDLKELYPKIKLIAAVPFRNQYRLWREQDKSRYFMFLEKADEVIYVDELEGTEYYSRPSDNKELISIKLKNRNKYMVDNVDIVYAYPSEKDTKSGTHHCIQYALKHNIEVKSTLLSVKK